MTASPETGWRRYFFRHEQVVRTTWTFRIALVVLPCLIVWATRAVWLPEVARGLVCQEQTGASDAILVENFDQEYLPFQRAAAIRRADARARVLVPIRAATASMKPDPVSARVTEVIADVAQLHDWEMVPVRETEPITLGVAEQVRDYLQKAGLNSVTVVAPAFRSRRSALVYSAVFGKAGIVVRCVPVFGQQTPETWSRTWHGIQEVGAQFAKLQYYRLYVLPRFASIGWSGSDH